MVKFIRFLIPPTRVQILIQELLKMKCEICHVNDAEQPIVKTENGVAKEYYVCKSCASQFKVGHIGKYSTADVLFDFSSAPQKEESEPPKFVQTCPTCGSSFAAIHKTRRVGCPDCYTFFEEQLERFIALYNMSDVDIVNQEVTALKQKLDVAIAEERFEEAAVLRDIINSKEKAKSLNPFANKGEKPTMPPDLLEAMKKMGIDIDIIAKPGTDDDDDLDIGLDDDDPSEDDDPF